MDEHLRAAGRSIVLRRTVNRWLEYAVAVWISAIVVLVLARWGDVDLTAMVVSLILLGCAFATVAVVFNLQFIDSSRRERVLTRRHQATRARKPAPPV
jgi:hypothetical protein